jgi:hypothetical protein
MPRSTLSYLVLPRPAVKYSYFETFNAACSRLTAAKGAKVEGKMLGSIWVQS